MINRYGKVLTHGEWHVIDIADADTSIVVSDLHGKDAAETVASKIVSALNTVDNSLKFEFGICTLTLQKTENLEETLALAHRLASRIFKTNKFSWAELGYDSYAPLFFDDVDIVVED